MCIFESLLFENFIQVENGNLSYLLLPRDSGLRIVNEYHFWPVRHFRKSQ